MKSLYATAIVAFVGLTISNFVWQAYTSQAWRVAVERSWFQFIAVAVLTGLLAVSTE